jgi:hypothetical protein
MSQRRRANESMEKTNKKKSAKLYYKGQWVFCVKGMFVYANYFTADTLYLLPSPTSIFILALLKIK